MGHFLPGMQAEKLVFDELVVRSSSGDDGFADAYFEAIQVAVATGTRVRLVTDGMGAYVFDPYKLVQMKDQFRVTDAGVGSATSAHVVPQSV